MQKVNGCEFIGGAPFWNFKKTEWMQKVNGWEFIGGAPDSKNGAVKSTADSLSAFICEQLRRYREDLEDRFLFNLSANN